jgi:hypothetical protein
MASTEHYVKPFDFGLYSRCMLSGSMKCYGPAEYAVGYTCRMSNGKMRIARIPACKEHAITFARNHSIVVTK